MGTRHLTAVIKEKKPVVAQYGQWDGYPSGQGATILEFLRTADLDLFKAKLAYCRFMNDDDEKKMKKFMESIGCKDGWMNGEQAEKYNKKYPYQNRDHGGKILQAIQGAKDEVLLVDSMDFAEDSLFCEWAYVIDLDKNQIEIYRGFNTEPLSKDERFYVGKEPEKSGSGNAYYPVKLVKTYSLNDLPEEKQFIAELEPKEEEV